MDLRVGVASCIFFFRSFLLGRAWKSACAEARSGLTAQLAVSTPLSGVVRLIMLLYRHGAVHTVEGIRVLMALCQRLVV